MLNRANEKQIHITETRNILTRPDDGGRITLAFRSVYEMVDETQKPRNPKTGILANSSISR